MLVQEFQIIPTFVCVLPFCGLNACCEDQSTSIVIVMLLLCAENK